MKAMILAAGRGERMRPLTDHCPKPLVPVGGKPLIARHLERLSALGVREVVINLSWLGEQIEQRLGQGDHWGLKIHYSHEVEALETGGGILRALRFLGDAPFLLVNGDVLTDVDPSRLRLASGDLCSLALVPNPPHNPMGDFRLVSGRSLPRDDGRPAHNLTYSGVALVDPAIVAGQPAEKFPLGPLLVSAAKAGRCGGYLHEGLWLDVGTAARLTQAEERLRENAS